MLKGPFPAALIQTRSRLNLGYEDWALYFLSCPSALWEWFVKEDIALLAETLTCP